MYAIIRYPADEKPGQPSPMVSIDDYCKMDDAQREAYCRDTATVWERETLAEIKDCLKQTSENPHCLSVEWMKGRRAILATRTDGRKFIFAIVRKRKGGRG